MAKGNTPKKKHSEYVADSTFSRSGEYRYLVSDMTEAEAKDMVCTLMDCAQDMLVHAARMRDVAEKHNLA